MWKPVILANGTPAFVDGERYGLGYFVQEMNGRRVIGHPGFHGSLILHFPDEGTGIVVLTNLDADSGPHHLKLAIAIVQRLPKYLGPESVEQRKPAPGK